MKSDGHIVIPGYVTDKDLETLANKLLEQPKCKSIALDLNELTFIEIGPLTFLISRIVQWQAQGVEVSIDINTAHSQCCGYLQRIDFFNYLGINMSEDFNRHSPKGRFHPVARIENQASGLADNLSEAIAEAVIGETSTQDIFFTDQPPEEGAFEAIAYSVSELIKNIQQHSKGKGAVVSQFYEKKGMAKLAIFDDGIGIRNSFIESKSGYSSQIKNDVDAIRLALEGEVSSKLSSSNNNASAYGDLPDNAGVGLTFLTMLAKRAGGNYTIISGNGLVSSTKATKIKQKTLGTFVHLSFNRDQLESFGELLEEIKREILPLNEEFQQEDLDSLFE
ncbi:hypothetical protein [Marinomonas sp. TW1]|uniref:hypothetical protein n=1 Tax=Marinomonas sp. TW1 TaxID=1561203 RepID=UPI0007AF52C9|nr:hypothetical protein [Marinomonas sp. TW1]KZN12168.1 hypothetical protein OA79_17640 [Marinomonas sp. TW1]